MIMSRMEANKWKYILKLSIPILFFILICIFSYKYLFALDTNYILSWWLTLLCLGISFMPLSIIIFNKFHDNGWIFSKVLGIAFCGWLMWLTASLEIIKFNRANCILIVIFFSIMNCIIFIIHKKKTNISVIKYFNKDKILSIVNIELAFFALIVFWCYFKGLDPDAYGTERFMDYGFMLNMYKSDYIIEDIWLSGNRLNYYYVGQYIMTYLTKTAGVPVAYGYNITLSVLFAFGFTLSYSIGNELTRLFIKLKSFKKMTNEEISKFHELGVITLEKSTPKFRPWLCGLIAGLAVAVCSNGHYPIYKYIVPKLQQLNGIEDTYEYWQPDATRFIGWRLYDDITDENIHDFPSYSYAVGDVHAHVVNTIFVLLLLGLMLAWLIHKEKQFNIVRLYNKIPKTKSVWQEIFNPILVIVAFLTGLFHATNYWDFPIYFVVCGAIILFTNLIIYRYKLKALWLTALQGIMFLLVGNLIILPFTLTFNKISSEIKSVPVKSPLWQLAIIWGIPFTIVSSFIIYRIIRFIKNKNSNEIKIPKELLNDVIEKEDDNNKKSSNKLINFLDSMYISDLYIILLGLCAFGLILIPEFIYVKDIYPGSVRSNTMFKLTYQSFIMLGLCMAYIVTRYLIYPTSKFIKGLGIVTLCMVMSTTGYLNETWITFNWRIYNGIDATQFIKEVSTADADAINWINANLTEKHVISEMPGLSYTYFNRISSFTGMPTVMGWSTHEWLWSGANGEVKPPEQDRRQKDMIRLYKTDDIIKAAHIVEKYNIDYIYYGLCEKVDGYTQFNFDDEDVSEEELQDRANFNSIEIEGHYYYLLPDNHETLCSLGEVVCQPYDIQTNSYSYLIKINRDYTKQLDSQYVYEPDEYSPSDPMYMDIEAINTVSK